MEINLYMILYNENNTDCYLLLLDASKAFDRVEYVKLFKMLKDRNMCPIVLRLLMNMYVNQKIQVRWNNLLSSQHNISNGVKQGGCLSPNLFSVYVNHLITKLRSSNLGCRYGNEYMGVYCYADDISLLSPTFTGLKEMLKICEDFADDHDIIFNASKSQLLQFSSCSNNINMKPVLQMRNGQKIPYVESCKHLGNEISTVNKKLLIQNAKCDLNCRMNSLLADFSYCNSVTISMLFKSYCMNIYGSQIWKFYNKEVNIFYTAWRKAIRQIYKLPYRTHNILINHIIQCYPIDIILEKRCIKFIWGLMNSEHILFNNIIKFSLFNMSTTIGENIKYFMCKYNITMSDWYNSFSCIDKKIDVYVNRKVDMNVKYTAHAIQDLCEMRDIHNFELFDNAEIEQFIQYLCIK